jgi:hypothetical protein
MTRSRRRFLPPAVVLLLVLISPHPSLAATFTVTTLADSGPGSLRQAVLDANAAAGQDLVDITVSGTITLTSGEIPITDDVYVDGLGAGSTTVSGNDLSRIFAVQGAYVTLSRLTLTRGRSPFDGGAVFAASANLTILDSLISDSRAGLFSPSDGCGGNVALSGGSLRIVNSALTGGTSESGGESRGGNLCVEPGNLSLERTTVSGGTAQQGGGLHLLNTTATILSSTISGNTADLNGGGVYFDLGDLLFLNSTISGNTAGGDGGGLYASSGGDGHPGTFVVLRLTTVSNNTAAESGSLHLLGDSSGLELDHSIVVNGAPEDMGPSSFPYIANYSLIEAASPPVLGSNNILGIDPLLGSLANNGGPTLTHLPLPGSPVIDAGNPAIPSPPPTDQRGFARIAGPAIDLGSVEAAAFAANVPTLSEWESSSSRRCSSPRGSGSCEERPPDHATSANPRTSTVEKPWCLVTITCWANSSRSSGMCVMMPTIRPPTRRL